MTTLDTDVFQTRSVEAAADEQFVRRWSPRAFAGESLSQEQIEQLIEAARWSPSCFNSQPWRFIYGLHGTPEFAHLLQLLMDMNQLWAQHAGALVAIVSKNTFDNGDSAATASFDTGSAWMAMALQAQHMGLASHAMWGFHHDRVAGELALPDDHSVQAFVAFGAPGEVADLPEKYQEREVPSPRKALNEIMLHGSFRQT